ncbi:DivIVA domain-containing protein [Streptococcus plurextorum]|uniref:DivIVA domain-containing protein n=1 Tax=Streptococcus plurextorum TaxID=456876 RepID=UPI0004064AD9|nr:DivIVA domain-containing protein [Streptococcus plurextorum]
MALTTLDIKDKTFSVKFRGYSEEEVNDFLDIVTDDYEALTRTNREQELRIRDLEEKLAYFNDMKESLMQSVVLAQETAEKVKVSAQAEAANLINKATYDADSLIAEAKNKANEILRDATDNAKRVAVETEDLKRQSRHFHQRLLSAMESQVNLVNSPEWQELLQPTAVYLQNSDAAFKEVVEKVLHENFSESEEQLTFDATRQFTPEEMEEIYRRVAEANLELENTNNQTQEFTVSENPIDLVQDSPVSLEPIPTTEPISQTFTVNIEG